MLTWPITLTLIVTVVLVLTRHHEMAVAVSNGGSIVSYAFGLLHLTMYDRMCRLESRLVRWFKR
jgi:hypothetical protein